MTFSMVVDQNLAKAEHYLSGYGSVQLVDGRALRRRDLLQAQALFVRSVTRVDEALLAGTPVKFVATATSGVDHIDRQYLQDHNIGFAYAPGSNANSVVEYVLSVIAAVDQKLEQLFAGGTVGIIGFGHIGRLLAEKLSSLGIEFKVYDPWLQTAQIPNPSELAEILACDVISVHAELTDKEPWPSIHLLAQRELEQISSQSLLINASRGAVLDNAALEQRLQSGRGPISVLDVWEDEPDLHPDLLRQVRYGSAHIAGYSTDGKRLATQMLRAAMVAHFGMDTIDNIEGTDGYETVWSITKNDQRSSASCLRSLLQQAYEIGLDDSLLRAAVFGQGNVASNFDQLRKQYRERFEISGRKVSAVGAVARTLEILKAMGCVVDQAAQENRS